MPQCDRSRANAGRTGAGKKVVRKRLADGTVKLYTYDRQTPGREGRYPRGSIGALIIAFKQSPEWQAKAPVTQRGYGIYLRDIERIKNTPVKELRRREILKLRDAVQTRSGPAAATMFVRSVSVLMAWAVDREWIEFNPAAGIRSPKGGHLRAWTEHDAALALASLPEPLRRVVVLGMWTGQRRGDLVRLPWSAYDGATLTIRQQKTKVMVILPVPAALRAELEQWRRVATSTLVLTNASGHPWDARYLSHKLPMELRKINGLPGGLNVHGLRKLFANTLAQRGCSTHEIASLTGHKTLAMVQLYTADVDQKRLAEAAVVKLETGRGNRRKLKG